MDGREAHYWRASVLEMNLRAPAKFPSLGRHFHFLSFFEKERNADLQTGFQLGRFSDAPARCVALNSWLGFGNLQLDEDWQIQTDGVPVELAQFNDRTLDQKIQRIAKIGRASCRERV